MILANVAAAETLERARVPLIYRVHDEPSLEKLEALREFLDDAATSRCRRAARCAPTQFNRILAQRQRPRRRAAGQRGGAAHARRRPNTRPRTIGHFGLNLRRYAHFTSPIRRYADLIVHRGLIRALKLRRRRPARQPGRARADRDRRADLRRRAPRHEGRARDHRPADRALPRRPHRRDASTAASPASPAPACSSSSTTPAPTASFRRAPSAHEYFRYEEAMHAMVGNRTGETHRLGDRVTVKLVEAAPVAGALRFELLSEGRVIEAGAQTPAGRSRPAAARPASAAARKPFRGEKPLSWKAPMTDIPPELMQKFSTDAMRRPSQRHAEGRLDADPARPQRLRSPRC